MVVNCAFPHCNNKWKKYRPLRFFRLPVQELETLKRWLVVLQIDLNTPFEKLYNVRVCGDHFREEDYNKPVKNPKADISKCRLLKKTAVPNAGPFRTHGDQVSPRFRPKQPRFSPVRGRGRPPAGAYTPPPATAAISAPNSVIFIFSTINRPNDARI